MFFGQKIQQNNPFKVTFKTQTQFYERLYLTNITLDVNSNFSQCYLKLKDKEILFLELNRQAKLVSAALNLAIFSKDQPKIVSKKGSVYICGHYEQIKAPITYQIIQGHLAKEQNPNTNKKGSSPKQSQKSKSTNQEIQESKIARIQTAESLQTPAPLRQSSRLSTRKISNPNTQSQKKQSQKQTISQNVIAKSSLQSLKKQRSKKQAKQQKKQTKKQVSLGNGRYSLKAMFDNLDNEDDDDQDDDEEFSDLSEGSESDEDSEFEQDDQNQNDEANIKKQQNKKASCQPENKNKSQERNFLKNNFTLQQTSQLEEKIVEQKSSKRDDKNQIEIKQQKNQKMQITEQFEQKWPTNQQQTQRQQQIKYQRIQQLTKHMKFPTKKPTI